jgi:hypothetical protein
MNIKIGDVVKLDPTWHMNKADASALARAGCLPDISYVVEGIDQHNLLLLGGVSTSLSSMRFLVVKQRKIQDFGYTRARDNAIANDFIFGGNL